MSDKKLGIQNSRACFDKSPHSSVKLTSYFDVYDKLFSSYAGKQITFVEIGVKNGGSLFMWREFFGDKARIIGIDLNPDAKWLEEHGFEIYIGSQSDPVFWQETLKRIGGVDILLDDGGHTFEQQIITVENVLPAIKDGGLLVVEDTHTSYMKGFGGPSKYSFVEYAKSYVTPIDCRFDWLDCAKPEETVYGLRFYGSIVVFEVDREKSFESTVVNNKGQTHNAADYRNYDIEQKLRLPYLKPLRAVKKIPGARRLINALRGFVIRGYNRYRNLKMKKYFKS